MTEGHVTRRLVYWLDDLELWRYRNKISTLGVGAAVLLHGYSWDNYGRLPCKDVDLARIAGVRKREWDRIGSQLKASWITEVDEDGTEWYVVRRVREQIDLARDKSDKARRARASRGDTSYPTDVQRTHNERTTDVERGSQTVLPRARAFRASSVSSSEPNRTEPLLAREDARRPEASFARAQGGEKTGPERPSGNGPLSGVLSAVTGARNGPGPPSGLGALSAKLTARFGHRGDFRALQLWIAEWGNPPEGAKEHVIQALLDADPANVADLVAYADRVRTVEEPNYHARQREAEHEQQKRDNAQAAKQILG